MSEEIIPFYKEMIKNPSVAAKNNRTATATMNADKITPHHGSIVRKALSLTPLLPYDVNTAFPLIANITDLILLSYFPQQVVWIILCCEFFIF